MHGPLGTYHVGPDGTYAESALGVYESRKGGTTTYSGGLGSITTGDGFPKYDPKGSNKNGRNSNAGGNWGKI
jgi:hypothetical protein